MNQNQNKILQNALPNLAPSKVASNDRFKEFRVNLMKAMEKKEAVKAVERLCKSENKRFRKQFESMTTLRRYYTHYRNVCREVITQKKDRPVLGACLEILNLTKNEIDHLNQQYEKKVATEHRSLRPLKNYDQMIFKAQELLAGISIYDRILGLTCLTGRRAAEIGCTAKFQPLRKNWMLFDGQLKGKTRLLHTYEMPVLADGALIVEALRSVRQQRPLWVENTVLFHDCGSRELSLRVKRHFSDFIENPAVKDLRAAYAEVCYHKFGTIRKAKTRFFSEILGHGEDDNITGQSYVDFYIVE